MAHVASVDAAAIVNATSWPVIVVSEGVPIVTPVAPQSTKPATGKARYDLVVSLQTELSRTGCYGGRIDGSWRMSSKRAMREFMERINASLPVDDPDYILLTLLQSHPASVCGRDCPKNQTLDADGRCLPNAIVARASRKVPSPTAKPAASETMMAWSTETIPAQPREPLPGRMSVGGPVPVAGAAMPGTAPHASPANARTTGTNTWNDGGAKVAALDAESDDMTPSATAAPGQSDGLITNAQRAASSAQRAASSPGKRASAKPVRAEKKYATTTRYRNVQNLFTHPLGRM